MSAVDLLGRFRGLEEYNVLLMDSLKVTFFRAAGGFWVEKSSNREVLEWRVDQDAIIKLEYKNRAPEFWRRFFNCLLGHARFWNLHFFGKSALFSPKSALFFWKLMGFWTNGFLPPAKLATSHEHSLWLLPTAQGAAARHSHADHRAWSWEVDDFEIFGICTFFGNLYFFWKSALFFEICTFFV